MIAEAELNRWWEAVSPDTAAPLHLRAIWPKGAQISLPAQNQIFTAADYPLVADRCAAVSASALMLNDQGYNIYTCVNPIKAEHTIQNVNDNDIACRRRLLIDIDRSGKMLAPASDDEISQAERLADRITDELSSTWGVNVFRVMSGNGVHLYLPLDDIANDASSKDNCRTLLKGLGSGPVKLLA